ncbi:hypothetical protein Agub_g4702 [Astrephomene gubernaculifera]|uniref:Tyrosine-protein kinase ephrin type A/B receptor-like domain-containing protein n=1 Tax=Astrephomene gubernaculifera TaxID=47775 RepID=A0AAD3DKK8_9CHLO|nr:hypothetical protein Agub_g4702 [Astrephomene gubernaculifera]
MRAGARQRFQLLPQFTNAVIALHLVALWQGSWVACGLSSPSDSSWAEQTIINSLQPRTVSNDGNVTLQAELQSPGCQQVRSAVTPNLTLSFLGAAPKGDDVLVPGTISPDCRSVTFRVAACPTFRGIGAGVYPVRLLAGRSQRPLLFASSNDTSTGNTNDGAGPSPYGTSASNTTTLVTVLQAAVARLLRTYTAASRSDATLTLTAALAGPSLLPATLALRLSDPTAAEVTPPLLTWRKGEAGGKNFTLRMLRALGVQPSSGQAAGQQQQLWAEVVAVSNVVLDPATPVRVLLQPPVPAFYVVGGLVLYRKSSGSGGSASVSGGGSSSSSSNQSSSNGTSSGSGGTALSSLQSGAAAGVGWTSSPPPAARLAAAQVVSVVNVTVRRANLSPFTSTLKYSATVLETIGCVNASLCSGVVRASGTLSFPADRDSAAVNVSINWAALPASASLRVGLMLTPVENAETLAATANLTAIYVYGTTYGTCPAGTTGPWRAPAPPAGAPPPPLGTGAAGNSSSWPKPPPAALAAPPVAAKTCDDAALLGGLDAYTVSEALLPVLTACTAGNTSLLLPEASSPSSAPTPATTPPPPASHPQQQDVQDGGPSAAQPPPSPSGDALQVLLRVPFGQDASAVFLPLRSAAEDVVVLSSSCNPPPLVRYLVGEGAGAGGGAGGAASWAVWSLPARVQQPCSAQLGVYVVSSSGGGLQQLQQLAAVGNNSSTGSSRSPSPTPPNTPSSPPDTMPVDVAASPGSHFTGDADSPDSTTTTTTTAPTASPAPPVPAPSGTGNPASLMSTTTTSSSGGLHVYNQVRLRTFNLTLQPSSDPAVFSGPRLSLALVHRPSGRILPLCGLPQQLLLAATAAAAAAAGSQAMGGAAALNASSGQSAPNSTQQQQQQLAYVFATLAEAIRGNMAAVLALQQQQQSQAAAPPTPGSSGLRRGRALQSSSSRGRGLRGEPASLLPPPPPSPPPASFPAAPPAGRPNPGAVAAAPTPPPPNSHNPPAPAPAPPPAGLPPSSSLPAAAPAPPQQQQQPPARQPVASRSAIALADTPPDGFNLPSIASGDSAAAAGTAAVLQVLYNPQYMDWCGAGEAQVVDLALLPPSYDMQLEASSGGVVLQQQQVEVVVGAGAGGGGEQEEEGQSPLVLGEKTRATLLKQRQAAAAAAAAKAPSPPSPAPVSARKPPASVLPIAAPAAPNRGTPQDDAGDDDDAEAEEAGGEVDPDYDSCPAAAARSRLQAEQRLLLTLLAPDGVTCATRLLDLYLDYSAAAAAAVAAAEQCSSSNNNNSSSNSPPMPAPGAAGKQLSSGTGPSAGGAGVPYPPSLPSSPPDAGGELLPVLLTPSVLFPLDACRRCGPGSYSAAANASVCLPCAVGSVSSEVYNPACVPCPAGTYACRNGTTCRLCPPGSFSSRPGSTACSVCSDGSTTLADGAAACVASPPPAESQRALLVSFQVLLNVSQRGNLSDLAADSTGIDAPPASIVRLLIAADTADALGIVTTQVRVMLQEVSTSAFLVNVSATMPLEMNPDSSSSSSSSSSSNHGSNPSSSSGNPSSSSVSTGSPTKDVDADMLVNRLVNNSDSSFPRTKEATGGSLHVQLVDRRVVTLRAGGGAPSVHAVVWPTLAGTAVLAVAVGWACRRYWGRRRGRQCPSLPPITDALGRLCGKWKVPGSPPPAYVLYGQTALLELQDLPASASAPRHRLRGGARLLLPSLPLGPAGAREAGAMGPGSASAPDLDALTAMYTREALAAPRI